MPKKTQEEKQETIPLMVRLPPSLHADIKELSEKDRRSLNTMVILLLEAQVKQIKTKEQTE